jgi:hypothetical protein
MQKNSDKIVARDEGWDMNARMMEAARNVERLDEDWSIGKIVWWRCLRRSGARKFTMSRSETVRKHLSSRISQTENCIYDDGRMNRRSLEISVFGQ